MRVHWLGVSLALLARTALAQDPSVQPMHADSVIVDSTAATLLALAYTPAREAAWCIDRYHVVLRLSGDPVPVIDRVHYLTTGDSLSVAVRDQSCFVLHTHPPEFAAPSWRDIGLAIWQQQRPFTVIQYGPHEFAGWVTDRLTLPRIVRCDSVPCTPASRSSSGAPPSPPAEPPTPRLWPPRLSRLRQPPPIVVRSALPGR